MAYETENTLEKREARVAAADGEAREGEDGKRGEGCDDEAGGVGGERAPVPPAQSGRVEEAPREPPASGAAERGGAESCGDCGGAHRGAAGRRAGSRGGAAGERGLDDEVRERGDERVGAADEADVGPAIGGGSLEGDAKLEQMRDVGLANPARARQARLPEEVLQGLREAERVELGNAVPGGAERGADATELRHAARELGVPFGEQGVRDLVPEGVVAIVLGESGAGKSTLLNALLGRDVLETGAVRASDDAGRHTTVARRMVSLAGAGIIVDEPGLRSLPLVGHERGLAKVFPDISGQARHCRFRNCTHTHEPGCAVLGEADELGYAGRRLEAYLALAHEMRASRQTIDPDVVI